jgi:hypothetical protein
MAFRTPLMPGVGCLKDESGSANKNSGDLQTIK